MHPRIQSVVPEEGYQLFLTFTNGETRRYDCTPLLHFGVFQELARTEYFVQARVANGTVVWSHEQDICSDTLYEDSVPAVPQKTTT